MTERSSPWLFGHSHNLTAVVTWLSAPATLASDSNSSGSRGLLTAAFQELRPRHDAVTVTP
jgi:hypothetical protein